MSSDYFVTDVTDRSFYRTPCVNWPQQWSFSLGHPDHLSGICNVVVLDDLASRVELSEVTVVGKRVAFAKGRSLKRNQHEDLVTAVEDRVRFKAVDLKRRH